MKSTWALAVGLAVAVNAAETNQNPFGTTSWEHAPTDYKPPAGLVRGGAFIDRILPMPVGPNGLRSDVWGGDNVKPRNVDNGIEDAKWSYWCMSVHREPDGREHLFGARWLESSPKGHMSWPNSRAFHAVSDSPLGPFHVVEEDIGRGHNVTCYRAKDGTYVLYFIGGAYAGPTVNGPWKPFNIEYDSRGSPTGETSNNQFTPRQDGSVLMVSRGGRIWISEDGLKPFRMITTESAYPKIKGNFEDPIVWRDEVQYNLIVNDWFGRSAYYLRSKDGVKWVWDQGLAYDVNVAKHADGTQERWYKFERPFVRQDEFGRGTHIYFAVIDSRKDLDKASDEHSSKVIALPLTVQRRLQVLNEQALTTGTKEIRVLLKAEPGFDPHADVELSGLRFGAPGAVDYGKGGALLRSEKSGADLMLVFDGTAAGFGAEDYVGKLLGTTRQGGLLFGYARMPGVAFEEPLVSAPPPAFVPEGLKLRVENFGLTTSRAGRVIASIAGATKQTEVAVGPIAPYAGVDVTVPVDFTSLPASDKAKVELRLECGGEPYLMKVPVSVLSPGADGVRRPELKSAIVDECGWGQSKSDRNLSGKDLVVGAERFAQGIGTHAPSRQEWLLDGSFSEFRVRAGVVSDQRGSIMVEVWGDGNLLHRTALLKGGDAPALVVVPVKGVRRLSLVATDGGDGNSADHVIYGEPMLIRVPASS